MHNIDLETGIHYGVISQNAVLEAWADSSEPDYGPPTCPKCGSENLEGEYYCSDCDYEFEGDEAFGDTENFYLSDGEYQAWSDSYGDIFITKSPYYTFRGFCSPCAPNACHLETEGSIKCYCFGPDWFEEGCPYPVYRVSDDVCIYKG